MRECVRGRLCVWRVPVCVRAYVRACVCVCVGVRMAQTPRHILNLITLRIHVPYQQDIYF